METKACVAYTLWHPLIYAEYVFSIAYLQNKKGQGV